MKVAILIGSIRKQRVSDRLAKWVQNEINKTENNEGAIIDLIDYNLPLFDEETPPQGNPKRNVNPEVSKFLEAIGTKDALVVVSPEYNRSYTSALKNALDYIDFQLEKKAVLLLAHGSTGGAQAVAHLRGVFPGLLAITVPRAIMIPGRVGEIFNQNGTLNDPTTDESRSLQNSLKVALSDLIWYSDALSKAKK
jgi:NAD(P)H-dependent FMN reductase